MKRAVAFLLLAAAVCWGDPCANCGTDVPADANFCPKCGTAADSAAKKRVDEAAKEAEKVQAEYLAALRRLKEACEAAGQTARARDVDALVRVVESTALGAGAGGGGGATPAAGTRNVKEANELYESAKLYMSTINPARRRGNLNIAAEKLRELVEKYPDSDKIADAHYNLGLVYADGLIDRHEEAIREFDRVKEIDPETKGDSRIWAAKIVDKLGRYQEAWERYQDVIDHDGNARNVEWARARRIQLEPYIKKK